MKSKKSGDFRRLLFIILFWKNAGGTSVFFVEKEMQETRDHLIILCLPVILYSVGYSGRKVTWLSYKP